MFMLVNEHNKDTLVEALIKKTLTTSVGDSVGLVEGDELGSFVGWDDGLLVGIYKMLDNN